MLRVIPTDAPQITIPTRTGGACFLGFKDHDYLYVLHVAKLYYITNENELSTGSRRISFLTSGHTQPHPLSWAGPATCTGGGHNHTATPPPCFAQRRQAGKIQDQW